MFNSFTFLEIIFLSLSSKSKLSKRLLRLEDYIDDEPKEVCYCPINKDEYILYNHIMWNSSDKYVILSGNIDDVIDKMYNYLRKKRELG